MFPEANGAALMLCETLPRSWSEGSYDESFSGQLLDDLRVHPCVLFGDPGRRFYPKAVQPLASFEYGKDGFSAITVFKL
jgi:hypothetical protein